MCDPVSAVVLGTMAVANMAIPMTREPDMPPPYVPPPPPPAPTPLTPQAPGQLSLGAKSPYETKLKARHRRQKPLPVSAMAGLNIPSAGDGGSP